MLIRNAMHSMQTRDARILARGRQNSPRPRAKQKQQTHTRAQSVNTAYRRLPTTRSDFHRQSCDSRLVIRGAR